MPNNMHAIEVMRERQLGWGIRALSVVSFFALVVSIARTFSLGLGWQNLNTLHVGLYLTILLLVFGERYLSFSFRAWVLVGIALVKGVTGIISFGLAGFGLSTLIMACVLCTVLLGVRIGIVLAVASAISVAAVGLAYHLNFFLWGLMPMPICVHIAHGFWLFLPSSLRPV